jgi:cbb3-type cytochrome oxidase maturation protein
MSVIIILVIIGVIVAGGFLAAFIWSVKSGQYDDTYSPAVRILFDDAKPVESELPKPSDKKYNNDDENREDKTRN